MVSEINNRAAHNSILLLPGIFWGRNKELLGTELNKQNTQPPFSLPLVTSIGCRTSQVWTGCITQGRAGLKACVVFLNLGFHIYRRFWPFYCYNAVVWKLVMNSEFSMLLVLKEISGVEEEEHSDAFCSLPCSPTLTAQSRVEQGKYRPVCVIYKRPQKQVSFGAAFKQIFTYLAPTTAF